MLIFQNIPMRRPLYLRTPLLKWGQLSSFKDPKVSSFKNAMTVAVDLHVEWQSSGAGTMCSA